MLYTSQQAHGAIAKAVAMLGIGLENLRSIATDDELRMRPDLLAAAIEDDRRSGRQPFCVVATAGTVNTGAIDPISELADLCSREELWLHIDGAYGALFVLSAEKAEQLGACQLADSLAIDPHKLLFAPLEAGCLVVRDLQTLKRAFSFAAPYLTADGDPLLMNFMDVGPQLSRDFKAFKVWCSLQVFGVRAFRKAIEHTLGLARYMADRIREHDALELLAPVPLTAVCFRHRELDDRENQELLTALVASGSALLGPVKVGERFGIRACITNYMTTRDDIDDIIGDLLRLAERRGISRNHGRSPSVDS